MRVFDFLLGQEARKRLRTLEERVSTGYTLGKKPTKELDELRRILSRRKLLTALAASGLGIGGGYLSIGSSSPEESIQISKLQKLSDTEFHDFTIQTLRTLGQDIPFFQRGLEAAQRQGYKFLAYKPGNNETMDEHSKTKDFNASTNRASKEVYFQLDSILREKLYRQNSEGRTFIACLSDELVHVMLSENRGSRDKLEQGVEDFITTITDLGLAAQKKLGDSDLTAELIQSKLSSLTQGVSSPGEKFMIQESIEEASSTLVSELILRSPGNQNLNAVMSQSVPGTSLTEDTIKDLVKKSIENRMQSMIRIFEAEQLSPGAREAVTFGAALMLRRIMDKSQYIQDAAIKNIKLLKS